MKVLIFSDSHGYAQHMIDAVAQEQPDRVIFLGDGERDVYALMRRFPDLPIDSVRGNVDERSSAPLLLRTTYGKKRIFAVHGHEYNVKNESGVKELLYAAMAADAHIVLFGHTHTPYKSRDLCMEVLNPGTISDVEHPTYGVLTIGDWSIETAIKQVILDKGR